MDATPRLRSAFPATPRRDVREQRPPQFNLPPPPPKPTSQLPQAPTTQATPSPAADEPLIPLSVIDAPSQRLYATACAVLLWAWRLYDFTGLQESDEQSIGLFLKWIVLDALFLFSIPVLRIPWLEWSPTTMSMVYAAHAAFDFMLMFRVGIPIGAFGNFLLTTFYGVYEMAINERSINPDLITSNGSLILGRQVIHILPEGSAIMNPQRQAFCLDQRRTEARLPIMINATSPISIDILRIDLDTQVNETLHISKSQIKTMHKDASRMYTYSEDPDKPKTLYYTVKKPGLYVLEKVVDESNLEVSRKNLAHTIVVPCPKAAIMPSPSDRCRGELSNVELLITGTPPLKVKYRKIVGSATQDATFESIQPEDLVSPLIKQNHNAVVLPNRIETDWARSRSIHVPLSESLVTSGRWAYAIDEVTDGLGNVATYTRRDQDVQERNAAKASHLHHVITVHERPNVYLEGCTPQKPLKVGKGERAHLPLRYTSSGRGDLSNETHHLEYLFSPEDDVSAGGDHGTGPQRKEFSAKNTKQMPRIQDPGLYTLTGVRTDFCEGDVMEPSSCLLQNPPEPSLSISSEEIFDKCAGSPVGLRVDLDLIGTPPFEVRYRMRNSADRYAEEIKEKVTGLRGQLKITPPKTGEYTYEFYQISDAVYIDLPVKGIQLKQHVKPSASAVFRSSGKKTTCIDERVGFQVAMQGEAPFTIEYEQIHGGRRTKFSKNNITSNVIDLETDPLKDGGDYTLALVSITDRVGCKEFLKDEMKISVRHQKPKVGFGQIEGRRAIDTLEGREIQLPLRLAGGEGPWKVRYLDQNGDEQALTVQSPNAKITVHHEGTYELTDVSDAICPGAVDEPAKDFKVKWIPRPEYRIPPGEIKERNGNVLVKEDVCEGDEDSVEVLFKGSPPYDAHYVQHVKPAHGAVTPKNKNLRAALNVASLRLDTAQAGLYDYKFTELDDANYKHSSKHFAPLTIRQRVHPRPSVAFNNPGKTYSFCSVESEGEEVIPITLQGQPPFDIEVEIKHHGTVKAELVQYNGINSLTHNIRIPHSRLQLGRSAVSLRRVKDDRGCSRSLDSTTPRVQISVHDAPSITPLEAQEDYCIGDRLNFALSGIAPFTVHYTFEGASHKAAVSSGSTFRRLAERPGRFAVTGLQDSASHCRAATDIVKRIHGLPSVRVSKGRDSYVDIHEGGQAEILFEFGGVPPFEFTYTRSSNTEKGGRKGVVLDMRSEVSDEHSMRIWASEEGTYEVVSIKDRYCSYTKPGIKFEKDQRRLQY